METPRGHAAAPPADFYTDPVDGDGLRYWDGQEWTEHELDREQPRPDTRQGRSLLGKDGVLETAQKQAGEYYKNNKPLVHNSLGKAMVVDGIVGMGRKRVGLLGAIISLLAGLIVVFGVLPFYGILNNFAGNVDAPVEIDAVVTTQVPYRSTGTCSVEFEFEVAGVRYSGQSSLSTRELCRYQTGDTIRAVYGANDPTSSNVVDGPNVPRYFSYFVLGFAAFGAVFAATGAWTLLLRLAQIVAGLVLIFKSRKKRTKEGEYPQ